MKRSTVVLVLSALFSLLTLGLSGCGGVSTNPIGVAIAPSTSGLDQGQTVNFTATVTNDSKNAGVTWSAAGGGTLSNPTTTSVTYNAPASVTSSFTATVTATSITDTTKSASLQFKVNPLPEITTTTLPTATAGTYYSAALSESGGTSPYTWTITSGTLPLGLSLAANAGAINGTPTGASSSSVTFQVKDAAGDSASQAITITVNPPPPLTITTTALAPASIGLAYSQNLQASGGVPTYKWSITAGSLPAGLTLSSAGLISGTPSGTAGTSNFTITVTDSQTPTASTKSANLSIVVSVPPLTVTTTSLAQGSIGTSYSQTLQAIGGTPPYSWSISVGTLPTGLTLNASTGVISGTPSAVATSNFTVKVTDSSTPTAGTATAALSITINTALDITTSSLSSGIAGTAYSATVNATGGAQPYAWSVTSGNLPAGLSIDSASGVISGTPTTAEVSNFTVTVADSESPAVQAHAALSITINSASCPSNSNFTGHYAMLLNGWSSASTSTAAAGSFVADGAGNISSGILDVNDQSGGPGSGTFTGTYCLAANNLATIKLTYGGSLSGTDTFAAALNSAGSNGNIIFYDTNDRQASGVLRQQDSSAFSTASIKGNYAFGFVGTGSGGVGRYALAGEFNSNGTGTLSGEDDGDDSGSLQTGQILGSSDFSVASTGRGTATITFTGVGNLKFVFYVVSASELLVMEDDTVGNPLVAGQVLQQSGSFTDASLDGVSVIELQSLGTGGTLPTVTAGLLTTTGNSGTSTLSADQNQAGTLGSLSLSGNFSTSSNGRVSIVSNGQPSPLVLYMIAPNQAFVVGADLGVSSGVLEPQSGSNFTASSLTGAYLGGSLQPVDPNVGENVDDLQANGGGAFTGTSDLNGSGGTSTNSIAWTYTVASDGRVVVSQSGAQVGIIYMISDTQLVFVPASTSDTNPALAQFQH